MRPHWKKVLVVLVVFAAGCDLVEDPVPPRVGDGGGGGGGGSESTRRRVLLEEFTGHLCNNCPAAHQIAGQLRSLYGDDLITVNIHATPTFAAPRFPPAPDGRYSTDFRTPAGDAYAISPVFGLTSVPAAMVNRARFNSNRTIGSGAWSSAVAGMVGLSTAFDLWFSELRYDATARTVSVEVKVAVLGPVTGDHNLTIYLLEDHVTDWQLNAQASPPDIPDYDHRYVLRTNLNGTWGVPLVSVSAAAGDTLVLSYPNFPVNPLWNPSNCSLVAFVHNTAEEEVMQAAEGKLIP